MEAFHTVNKSFRVSKDISCFPKEISCVSKDISCFPKEISRVSKDILRFPKEIQRSPKELFGTSRWRAKRFT